MVGCYLVAVATRGAAVAECVGDIMKGVMVLKTESKKQKTIKQGTRSKKPISKKQEAKSKKPEAKIR